MGIVAAITIPALVRRHIENSNRTKIKKAMTVYDTILNKMVVENGIKDDTALETFAGNEENNCAGASQYFKLTDGSGCVFKTAEGVWWDISDIKNPIIALNRDNLNEEAAEGDENVAFRMVGHIDSNGSVRVNDPKAEEGAYLKNLTKLYNFVKPELGGGAVANGGGEDDNGENDSPQEEVIVCSDDTKNDNGDYVSCTECSEWGCDAYDENGKMVASGYDCSGTSVSSCNDISINTYDEFGSDVFGSGCHDVNDFSKCEYISTSEYDGAGRNTSNSYNCSYDDGVKTCEYYDVFVYENEEDDSISISGSGCLSLDISNCNSCFDSDGESCINLGFTNCSDFACCAQGLHYDEENADDYHFACIPD